MKSNLSIFDSILRLFIGMVFAGICGAMGWIVGVLALYPIVTALTAYDPIYANMGFSTATEHAEDSDKIDYDAETAAPVMESRIEYRQTA